MYVFGHYLTECQKMFDYISTVLLISDLIGYSYNSMHSCYWVQTNAKAKLYLGLFKTINHKLKTDPSRNPSHLMDEKKKYNSDEEHWDFNISSHEFTSNLFPGN